MPHESFKQLLGEILSEKGNSTPKTLDEIVEMSGYSRATVHKWLKELESLGMVEKNQL